MKYLWIFINHVLTHTHPHLHKIAYTTHTQPRKDHTHPHPAKKMSHTPTPSQKKVTLTYNHPYPAKKRSTFIHTQPKKGHTHLTTTCQKNVHIHLNLAVYLWIRKFFIIHQLIKFIRSSISPKYNFRRVQCQTIGISIQHQTNDKLAAVINNFRYILTKITYHLPAIVHAFTSLLTIYCFFSTAFTTLYYFRCHVYYFVNFAQFA